MDLSQMNEVSSIREHYGRMVLFGGSKAPFCAGTEDTFALPATSQGSQRTLRDLEVRTSSSLAMEWTLNGLRLDRLNRPRSGFPMDATSSLRGSWCRGKDYGGCSMQCKSSSPGNRLRAS